MITKNQTLIFSKTELWKAGHLSKVLGNLTWSMQVIIKFCENLCLR